MHGILVARDSNSSCSTPPSPEERVKQRRRRIATMQSLRAALWQQRNGYRRDSQSHTVVGAKSWVMNRFFAAVKAKVGRSAVDRNGPRDAPLMASRQKLGRWRVSGRKSRVSRQDVRSKASFYACEAVENDSRSSERAPVDGHLLKTPAEQDSPPSEWT